MDAHERAIADALGKIGFERAHAAADLVEAVSATAHRAWEDALRDAFPSVDPPLAPVGVEAWAKRVRESIELAADDTTLAGLVERSAESAKDAEAAAREARRAAEFLEAVERKRKEGR